MMRRSAATGMLMRLNQVMKLNTIRNSTMRQRTVVGRSNTDSCVDWCGLVDMLEWDSEKVSIVVLRRPTVQPLRSNYNRSFGDKFNPAALVVISVMERWSDFVAIPSA